MVSSNQIILWKGNKWNSMNTTATKKWHKKLAKKDAMTRYRCHFPPEAHSDRTHQFRLYLVDTRLDQSWPFFLLWLCWFMRVARAGGLNKTTQKPKRPPCRKIKISSVPREQKKWAPASAGNEWAVRNLRPQARHAKLGERQKLHAKSQKRHKNVIKSDRICALMTPTLMR